MSVAPDDPKLLFIPFDEAIAARGLVMAYHDYYWSVCPRRGLIFYRQNPRRDDLKDASPQCNSSEAVARSVAARLYPWAEVRQIPLVLAPTRMD